jgi:DNA-binding response OmpR family regulator
MANVIDEEGEKLASRELVVDTGARIATVAGRRVPLTRKEFDLLTVFLRKAGRALSVPFLLETVWGYDPADYSDPHTIGAHVFTLRRKIGPKAAARIVALPGIGYRFDATGGTRHAHKTGRPAQDRRHRR